jgi:hypothetical protein
MRVYYVRCRGSRVCSNGCGAIISLLYCSCKRRVIGRSLVGISIERHLINHFLRYSQALDAKRFKIDLAICDSALQLISPATLNAVHGATRCTDDKDENAEDYEKEDP